MDLSPYVAAIRRDLAIAAEAGGDDARALAERLTAPLEPALRLALLGVLSDAAAEISRELAPRSVDLLLREHEPTFFVSPPAPESASDSPRGADLPPAPTSLVDDGPMTRINLRLPQPLKDRVEEAAEAAGVSVNSWLVRAAVAALEPRSAGRRNAERYLEADDGYPLRPAGTPEERLMRAIFGPDSPLTKPFDPA
ncbi:ribbon-helix-helix protein, CopG family [Rhodococcus spongiicola]|uniref:Ribbon-helix-helix protein, CopG family n=1 Tax=Rhodococcus spongiicola TaxID=2487352 RepID=A0A438B607_9NOCA|nr:ribbon-helix-helix protein, CopG family [Rhodococcus spongiicola]